MQSKMKVEIWSDVMCPFCYIGKERFEKALDQISQKEQVEVIWKSFQLQPNINYQPGKDAATIISELKGIPPEQMLKAHTNMEAMAKDLGVTMNFKEVKLANTFDALRLVKLADKYGLANDAEDRLFKAHFAEGKVVSDHDVLIDLSAEIGLNKEEAMRMLSTNTYANEVDADVEEARQIGISGVPFFVFDRKYAVSGAQPIEAFVETIQASLNEWHKESNTAFLSVTEGESCSIDGEC